jgi:hypothetical protein
MSDPAAAGLRGKQCVSVGNERVAMERVMIDGVGAYFRHELSIVSSGLAPISRTVSKGQFSSIGIQS